MSDINQPMAGVTAFWEGFRKAIHQPALDTTYEVWHFGDSRDLANELADLVESGKKTATASLLWEYEAEVEPLPQVGGYSIITDFDGEPIGVIQTVEVRILPFDGVEADFAADEGERRSFSGLLAPGALELFLPSCLSG